MPKEFLYSRKFASQDKKVTTLSGDDVLTFSILEKGVYVTKIAKVKAIAVNTETNLKENNTLAKLAYGNGLVGKGVEDNPLNIDSDWMDQHYLNNKAWGFSQVGNPADSELPISGTYLSVSYPFYSGPAARVLPMFPEANGDLSILKPVTNGEFIAYVYATWKNYEAGDLNTVTVSDTQYEPPGLLANEWISRCYNSSETSMIVEISTRDENGNTAFKEFALITLNGTLSAKQHTIRRLGTSILSDLIGWATPTATQWIHIRLGNITAIEKNDVVYIAFAPRYASALHGEGANAFTFVVGQLNSNNNLSLITGWTGGNDYGDVIFSTNVVTLFSTIFSRDRSLSGSMVTIDQNVTDADNVDVITFNNTTANSDIKIAFNHWDGQDIVLTYTILVDTRINAVLKQRRFISNVLKLNPITKVISYYPVRKHDRLTISQSAAFNNVGKMINWAGFSSTAIASLAYILPNGMRIGYKTSSESTFPPELIIQSPVYNGLTYADYLNDDNVHASNKTKDLDATPPTAVKANRLATMLHNRLVLFNAAFRDNVNGDNSSGNDVYAQIEGSATKTYNVLDATNPDSAAAVTGYTLNTSRGYLGKRVAGSLVSVSVGNMIYYHNATWSNNKNTDTRHFAITKDFTSTSTYKLDPSVTAKINAYIATVPVRSIRDEYFDLVWLFTPVYPGIGKDFAFLEFIRIENSTGETNGDYARHRMLVPITNTKDSAGNYTVTDVNFDDAKVNVIYQLTQRTKLNTGMDPWQQYFRTFKFFDSGNILVGHRGGPTYSDLGGSTWYDRSTWYAKFDSGLNMQSVKNCAAYILPSIESNTKEIGFVNILAGGGFYGFYPVNENLDIGSPTILTSPRPPAGFTITVATPIPVNVLGRQYYIEPFVLDLTTHLPDVKNKTLYLSAEIQRGVAYITVQYDRYAEHEQRIHIGTITTTESEISEIKTKPVTLWECARPSVDPIGAAISVSTGHPSDTDGVTLWENITLLNQSYSEYFWGPRDIIDID